MSGKAIYDTQTTIYELLSNHPKLTGIVYDDIPDEAPYPYVTIGEFTSIPNRSFDRKGYEISATLHVWSDYPGNHEGLELIGYVDELLEDTVPLLVSDKFDCISCEKEMQETVRDGILRHFPVRYRMLVQEKGVI